MSKKEIIQREKAEQGEQMYSRKGMKAVNSIKIKGIGVLVLVFVGVIFWRAMVFHGSAKMIGNTIGSVAGAAAGIASGSYEGITTGIKKGDEAGKTYGLSAEDTTVELTSEIVKAGRLEVLVAESQLVDEFTYGKDYKGLFAYKAKINFSVDLTQAEVTSDETTLNIVLPELVIEINIDEDESEKLASWQKYFFSGSSEDGYNAYMNSMEKMKEKGEELLPNYEYLLSQAETLAENQVEILASTVCSNEGKKVNVHFRRKRQ